MLALTLTVGCLGTRLSNDPIAVPIASAPASLLISRVVLGLEVVVLLVELPPLLLLLDDDILVILLFFIASAKPLPNDVMNAIAIRSGICRLTDVLIAVEALLKSIAEPEIAMLAGAFGIFKELKLIRTLVLSCSNVPVTIAPANGPDSIRARTKLGCVESIPVCNVAGIKSPTLYRVIISETSTRSFSSICFCSAAAFACSCAALANSSLLLILDT